MKGQEIMIEETFDQKLNIKTAGIREWKDPNVPYNRCESTPYKALERLFQFYSLTQEDKVVDFGIGRGRVSFYIHHKFHISVTGIEVHEQTLDEALDNKKAYRYYASDIPGYIDIQYGLAEQYEIRPDENIFYFFNPFSVEIFEEVVQNILHSLKNHPRTVDLILYYPLNGYKHYLQKQTPFKLLNKITIPDRKDKKEKFLIYRFSPEQSTTTENE